MASISEIQEIARKLGLLNIANGKVDLNNETLSNTDYLLNILKSELETVENAALIKRRQASQLPHRTFSIDKLNKGIAWQIEQLEKLDWIENAEDLIIIGKCDTGKTSLAVHLAEKALKNGERVFYADIDTFLEIIRHKDHVDKFHRKFRYMLSCGLIIIDEIMYVTISPDDLPLFYRSVNFLKEERSMIFITNRELSDWTQVAEDHHLMQTLTEKLMSTSQLIRMT